MNVHLSQTAGEGRFGAPLPVQKAFIKQINFLVRNLNHPRFAPRSLMRLRAVGKRASMTIGAFTSLSTATLTASARSSPIPNSLCRVAKGHHPHPSRPPYHGCSAVLAGDLAVEGCFQEDPGSVAV